MRSPLRLFGYFSDHSNSLVLFIQHEHFIWHVGETLEEYGATPPSQADYLGEITEANETGIMVDGEFISLPVKIAWQVETLKYHEFVVIRSGEKVFIGRKPSNLKYNTPEIIAAEVSEMKKKFGFSKLATANKDDWQQDMRVAGRKSRK